MKSGCFFIVGILASVLASGCNEAVMEEAIAAPEASAGCSACHQGKRSFKGREVAELAEAIRSIRDGKVHHPPLRLSDESDAAVDALAKQLAAN